MKRDTRYWSDPTFRAAVDREKDRAKAEASIGGWVTYAIHDPSTPDTVGEFNTLIIYVGQTKQFDRRVEKRLRAAGVAVKRPTKWIDGALYDIMSHGRVPRFRVIERVGDAIDSFVSETNWAKCYIEQGYPIRNKWTEQQFAGKPIDRYTVPHKWLMRLAVEDALEARFDLVLVNKTTAEELVLDLTLWPRKRLLREVAEESITRLRSLGFTATTRIVVR